MAIGSKLRKPSKPQGGRRRILVVTQAIRRDVDVDDATAPGELARLFAEDGDDVTLLWVVGRDVPSADEVAAYRSEFEAASVKLEVLDRSDQLLPSLATPESRSAALLHYLERSNHDLVYAPLEGGLAYYTLLASETGAFQPPPIIVFANAPEEWAREADKAFMGSTEAIAIAYMEKCCAEMAGRTICASATLRKWMLSKGWKVRKAAVMPMLPLSAGIGRAGARPAPKSGTARELAVFSTARFRDGLTLVCDALDLLAPSAPPGLTLTAFAPFGKIMGEHSGGLLLRRAEKWPFKLKLLPAADLDAKLDYVQRNGALAVIPSLAASTGAAVATCIAAGLPFVATNAGANAEAWNAEAEQPRLVEPDAGQLARSILAALGSPPRPRRIDVSGHCRQAWLATRNPPASAARRRVGKRAGPAPLVSIVMAHRNRPLYLKQAIAAIEAQTYDRLELVLVDDGSDQDEARRLLDALEPAFRQRRWKILRRTHKHLGAARNAGVRAARGELILFADDDNALFPEAVDQFVRAMTASGADICTAFQLIFYEDFVPADRADGLIQYLPLGGPDALGLIHNVYGDANAMVRREVFSQIGFLIEEPGYAMHDWEFFARASLAGLRIRPIPKPLYWYRSKPDGMFRTSNWYDNRRPIIEAFRSGRFDDAGLLYQLAIAQNTARSEIESARENLRYTPAYRKYLELCDLEPNSNAAIGSLAAIALSAGRPDTAATLLEGDAAKTGEDTPDEADGADGSRSLAFQALRSARLLTPRVCDLPLLLVARDDGGVFLRPHLDGPVAASLDQQFPPFFRRLEAAVEVAHSNAPAIDFGLALARPDWIIDWQQDIARQTIAFSGWTAVRDKFARHRLVASLRVRHKTPLSIILAVRFAETPNGFPTNAFFRKLTLFSD
ncbi:glycosyltransferase [Mesorhizobium sp.]|uniref:glycosyltransferase n=1 Tax=Mesorhizobium sp. TaxID=1871066 RepID=UPI000FE88B89|nr:glycosyltransferase [Mesorhizobium sp.]RWD93972.1 MAG: glycosyltransferase [Mesorhizobium sp.]